MEKQKIEEILELWNMLKTSWRNNKRFRFASILILMICSSVLVDASWSSSATSTVIDYVSYTLKKSKII